VKGKGLTKAAESKRVAGDDLGYLFFFGHPASIHRNANVTENRLKSDSMK
jgi:hypothetical protein